MAIKTTIEEHKLLVKADEEIANIGSTTIRCPRCGNEIVVETAGSSYSVRCKTDDCISADFRGI